MDEVRPCGCRQKENAGNRFVCIVCVNNDLRLDLFCVRSSREAWIIAISTSQTLAALVEGLGHSGKMGMCDRGKYLDPGD